MIVGVCIAQGWSRWTTDGDDLALLPKRLRLGTRAPVGEAPHPCYIRTVTSTAANTTATVAKSSGRGSKPGERRGGRKKGTPNKATADIRDVMKTYTPAAAKELARLAVEAESEAARVSAIKEIFDRAYGRATQLIGSDPQNPLPAATVLPVAVLSESTLREIAAAKAQGEE